LSAKRIRMLAGWAHGSTELVFNDAVCIRDMLRDSVHNGLATAECRTMRAGRRLIEVTWMTITDAGRRALAE
jgi:hypothetical protein